MSEPITREIPNGQRAGSTILVHTLRYAPARIARRYPFAATRRAHWTRCDGGWCARFPLPELPNDHIVVPSVAQVGENSVTDFRIDLAEGDATWSLWPTAAAPPGGRCADARVTTHIDYFHCRAALAKAVITVTVPTPREPDLYLITIASRPYRCVPDPGDEIAPRLVVPAISQMTAPRAIRHRICSPTCITMALRYHERHATLAQTTRTCFHPPSQLYGVWPLAIRCGAAAGLAAATECFTDLDTVARIVAQGLPVIASIRFGAGALPGAALSATDGHLVVVTGFDADCVYINDPAAKDASSVPRECPRREFAAAWLTERGVGYVMSPL